eukprot:9231064-Pyramimonas_sp.AAC.1
MALRHALGVHSRQTAFVAALPAPQTYRIMATTFIDGFAMQTESPTLQASSLDTIEREPITLHGAIDVCCALVGNRCSLRPRGGSIQA